jgi:hypothetical protein
MSRTRFSGLRASGGAGGVVAVAVLLAALELGNCTRYLLKISIHRHVVLEIGKFMRVRDEREVQRDKRATLARMPTTTGSALFFKRRS